MKLYRGIKAEEFSFITPALDKKIKSQWRELLELREGKSFAYPHKLNSSILELEKLSRLQRQFFTDKKAVALAYAKTNRGIVVEIDVPINQILRHFTLEFQNFSQRKKNFELVYAVDARVLCKYAKAWQLKEKRA